jgi:hypothetical protein
VENVANTVIDLFQSSLDVHLSENDINFCHRIGKKNESKPILLSLVHLKNKYLIFKNAHKLKNSDISISDDLTPKARIQKQIIYKKFVEAKKLDIKHVKKYKNFLVINNQKLYYNDLIADNFSDLLNKIKNKETSRKNSTGSVGSNDSVKNQGNEGGPRRGPRRGQPNQ